MSLSTTKLFIGSFVVAILFLFIYYQYTIYFDTMEEGFISANYANFGTTSKYIQEKINNVYPNITIDLSANGAYFSRITDLEMDIYASSGNRWSWTEETMNLYRQFLYEQGYNLSSDDFMKHTNKLRTVYNQYMILELMSQQTDQGQIFYRGLVVDNSNNVVKPLPKQYNTWTEYYTTNNENPSILNNQSIIKCQNKQLKKFSASSTLSSSQTGVDVSLSDLSGITFKDNANKFKCNPCDVVDVSRNFVACDYNINFTQPIGYDIFQMLYKSRL